MGKWNLKITGCVALVMLAGSLAPVVGANETSATTIVDYSSVEQIVDRYLGVQRGESQRRIAEEHSRLKESARLNPTSVVSAYVVFARPVQGTEIASLVATFNLTLESVETNGLAGQYGDSFSRRIERAQLAELGNPVGLQVNTFLRELREYYIAQGMELKERDPIKASRLLLLASSSDFGIYRAAFRGRTIDFLAATADPAVRAVILTPLAGNDWKRLPIR